MRSMRTDVVYLMPVHSYVRTLPASGSALWAAGTGGGSRRPVHLAVAGSAPAARCSRRSRRTTVASAPRRTPFFAISFPITLWPATSQGKEGTDEIHASDTVYAVLVHPYARTLLDVIPLPGPHRVRAGWKVREPPDPPVGCRFLTRGPLPPTSPVRDCGQRGEEDSGLRHLASDHAVACHFAGRGESR
ncbi:hypothetical protein OG417_17990 [Actinoallomurus sp. NBC_01490]|uniref:hypothetical protein n=1 Tax=Actinoallomurus sp. NBC_01490 TaxID=2903557 RepID=UPI002E2F780A|nr:hypothetical protein [Actinoallomurus sp. NBC_01490]